MPSINRDISVIIPCRNEEKYIKGAITSILNQTYSQGKLEVIVVDGMSNDNTLEIIQSIQSKDERVKLVVNPAQTTPQAMNLGLKNSTYNLIIRIDAHAEALPMFIEKNVQTLFEDDKIGCAGGKIINVYENKTAELIGLAMSSKFGVGNAVFRVGGEKSQVDTLAFGIYKKSVFDEIGIFNENLIRNQDDELNFRLIQAGYKIIYNPEIQSKYYVRSSYKKLYKQYNQYGYWKVYVNRLHKTITSIRQLIPFFFVCGLFIGGIVSIILPYFYIIYYLGITLYISMALYFGFKQSKNGIKALKISSIFPILHFSYGLGYLKGIIHFMFLNKNPSAQSKTLSRD